MHLPPTTVKDWMQTNLHVVHPHDSIDHARELCERHRVNQLPVISGDKLVGIVTDRDLRDAFPSIAEQARHPAQAHRETASVRVEDVMTANVLTVVESDPLEQAATIMRRERLGSLPVVRNGHLVGILTRADLLGAFVALATASHATTQH